MPKHKEDHVEHGPSRAVDRLGRVVIPSEIRKEMRIEQGDMVAFVVNQGRIIADVLKDKCSGCGRPE